MSKYVIYTCIVGGYDELLQPAVTDPDFDFVCFVGRGEKTADRVGAWAVREFDCGLEDLRIVSRYPKMHPHVLLPEYEASVWIDGNVRIMDGTIFEAVRARMADGSVYAGVRHPSRDCLYAEAWMCDQLSFPWCLGECGVPFVPFLPDGMNTRNCPGFRYLLHK